MTTEGVDELKRITSQRSGHKAYATTMMKEAKILMQKNPLLKDAVRLKAISSSLAERLEIIESFDNKINWQCQSVMKE